MHVLVLWMKSRIHWREREIWTFVLRCSTMWPIDRIPICVNRFDRWWHNVPKATFAINWNFYCVSELERTLLSIIMIRWNRRNAKKKCRTAVAAAISSNEYGMPNGHFIMFWKGMATGTDKALNYIVSCVYVISCISLRSSLNCVSNKKPIILRCIQ